MPWSLAAFVTQQYVVEKAHDLALSNFFPVIREDYSLTMSFDISRNIWPLFSSENSVTSGGIYVYAAASQPPFFSLVYTPLSSTLAGSNVYIPP